MAAVKLTASIVEKFIPPRAQNSRKGDNGKILILGGSYVYHGAPILASLAALRCGTDLVYTAVPKINSQATRAASPNLIVIPLADQKLTRGAAKKLLGQTPVGLDSAAIGMGLAVQERNSLLMLIKTLLDSDVRLLLDASALVPEVLQEISGKNWYTSYSTVWSIFPLSLCAILSPRRYEFFHNGCGQFYGSQRIMLSVGRSA